jgi:hypothetical protein
VGKYIPVEPEKWAEMVKALALVKEMDKTINASQAECRRLKEKSECQAECLEAFDKENARLKDENERLRKAGDAMAKRTEFFQKRWDADELCQEVEAWNAAKEGKPSV